MRDKMETSTEKQKIKIKQLKNGILEILIHINISVNINLSYIHTHINPHHLEKTEFHTFICKFGCLEGTPSFQRHVQCHVSFFILHLQCDQCVYMCMFGSLL